MEYFECLPNELIVEIFSSLSPRDLVVCERVCTHWREILLAPLFDIAIWKKSFDIYIGGSKQVTKEYTYRTYTQKIAGECGKKNQQQFYLIRKLAKRGHFVYIMNNINKFQVLDFQTILNGALKGSQLDLVRKLQGTEKVQHILTKMKQEKRKDAKQCLLKSAVESGNPHVVNFLSVELGIEYAPEIYLKVCDSSTKIDMLVYLLQITDRTVPLFLSTISVVLKRIIGERRFDLLSEVYSLGPQATPYEICNLIDGAYNDTEMFQAIVKTMVISIEDRETIEHIVQMMIFHKFPSYSEHRVVGFFKLLEPVYRFSVVSIIEMVKNSKFCKLPFFIMRFIVDCYMKMPDLTEKQKKERLATVFLHEALYFKYKSLKFCEYICKQGANLDVLCPPEHHKRTNEHVQKTLLQTLLFHPYGKCICDECDEDEMKKLPLITLLLEYGANPNAPDSRGWTCAHYVTCSLNASILPLLCKYSLSFEFPPESEHPLFSYARSQQPREIPARYGEEFFQFVEYAKFDLFVLNKKKRNLFEALLFCNQSTICDSILSYLCSKHIPFPRIELPSKLFNSYRKEDVCAYIKCK